MVTAEQGPTKHVILHWFHYYTQRNNVLTSVVVDLTFGDDSEDAALDWCTIVSVKLRYPKGGWATKTESDILGALEAELEEAANQHKHSLLDKIFRRSMRVRCVGRETGDGVQTLYFYGTARIPGSVFDQVLAKPEFDNEHWSRKVSQTGEKDDSRRFYTSNLHPGAALNWLILTETQLETLEKEGDDLDTLRDVDHELSFKDADSRRRFVEALIEVSPPDHWTIRLGPDPSPEGPAFRLTVTHRQSVNKLWADVYVTALSFRAESVGGEYEGWGALAMTDEIKRLTSEEDSNGD